MKTNAKIKRTRHNETLYNVLMIGKLILMNQGSYLTRQEMFQVNLIKYCMSKLVRIEQT